MVKNVTYKPQKLGFSLNGGDNTKNSDGKHQKTADDEDDDTGNINRVFVQGLVGEVPIKARHQLED